MKLNFFHHRSTDADGTGGAAVGTVRAAGARTTQNGKEAEIVAAIAVALCLEEDEWHDWEPAVLTINNAAPSPWSSKILAVMNQPVKK